MSEALTAHQRGAMAMLIIENMREAYEAEGEEGDFGDGERHLRDDASDGELIREWEQWCPGEPLPARHNPY